MRKSLAIPMLAMLLICQPLVSARAETPVATTEPQALALPANIRKALLEEMAALQSAMAELAEAIPQRDWARIAETAAAMRDGFILKKALTPAERATLHAALPERFLLMDGAFHAQADRLAAAAQARDAELVPFHFYKMTDSCVTCHGAYAQQRFPGAPAPAAHDHRH